MIVPTTILSLVALSAAESNSFGKRGLRKSSTPWTAVAVVAGTAVVGLGAGLGIGYGLFHSSDPEDTAVLMVTADKKYWGDNSKPNASPVEFERLASSEVFSTTTGCTNGQLTNSNNSSSCRRNSCNNGTCTASVLVQNSDCSAGSCKVCPTGVQCKLTGCEKGWYQNGAYTCASCTTQVSANSTKAAARFIKGTGEDADGNLIWDAAVDTPAQKALCGCEVGFWLNAPKTVNANNVISWGTCTATCPAGTTPQTIALVSTTTAQTEADCNMCKANHYQNGATTCHSCPDATPKKAATALRTGEFTLEAAPYGCAV